jgi:arsenite methyltransferase
VALSDLLFGPLARQLGGPHGPFGGLVARRLNRFNRTSLTAAVDLLAPPPGSAVADVGFGGGLGLELLADRSGADGVVHGVDPMPAMVKMARRRHRGLVDAGRLRLHETTADALPMGDDALDGAISNNTVYFWPELGPSLAELARVIRPGGALILGLADPSYFDDRPFEDHGFHIRPVDEVGAALEAAGFDPPTDHPVDIDRTIFHLLEARVTR